MKTIENLLQEADFTKESDLYEKLNKQLFHRDRKAFLDAHRLEEDELEELAAAGTIRETEPEPDIGEGCGKKRR